MLITQDLAARVLAGDPRAIARAISLVENEDREAPALMRAIFSQTGRAFVVGVTGPPGAGKSTLVDRLTVDLRRRGASVGVLAVDPTSPFSGGAVLGDRVRMQGHAGDAGVFIRSMATRGHLGGLARATGDAALVLDAAGKEVVLIETVGVGQDEVDIVRTADVSIVTLVPGAGDDVQAMKAGIMEIADIFVVNKADREEADRLVAAIESTLALQTFGPADWRPPVIKTVATTGAGVPELVDALFRFRSASEPIKAARRHSRAEVALRELISRRVLDYLERKALTPGELDAIVARVTRRELDPYTAADELLRRAGLTADPSVEGAACHAVPDRAMKAILDHVGIAVTDLAAALRFYRDALGLEIEPPEEVPTQRVRAHFVPLGSSGAGSAAPARLELLEATAPDSPIGRFLDKRGPGLHHITLLVDDIHGTLARLKERGARLIDPEPRPGAEGALVAFIHPSSAHGVLVELKQPARPAAGTPHPAPGIRRPAPSVHRYALGDLELISVSDGLFRLDGGSMFGVVPKTMWSQRTPSDDRNRIVLSMRPLVVRGRRTMIIDAGMGDKESDKFHDIYGVDRTRHLDHALAEAGLAPEDIDVVLASHLHFDHAGGFTTRDASGRLRPRFPRAQYVVRRGEWEDATHPNARTRASYLLDNYVPLADAGVLQLVDDDQTIMPGVRIRRTGGHTPHHQMVLIESGGQTAAFVADLMPTTAHLPDVWVMGYDLLPLDTMAAKARFATEAIDRRILIFFEHDPVLVAGYLEEEGGKRRIVPQTGA